MRQCTFNRIILSLIASEIVCGKTKQVSGEGCSLYQIEETIMKEGSDGGTTIWMYKTQVWKLIKNTLFSKKKEE